MITAALCSTRAPSTIGCRDASHGLQRSPRGVTASAATGPSTDTATCVDGAASATYVDGVTSTEQLVAGGTSRDPAVGLRAVAALRRLTEQLEDLQVQSARQQGWSWSAIAAAIGVSKQAVHKKHAGRLSSDVPGRP